MQHSYNRSIHPDKMSLKDSKSPPSSRAASSVADHDLWPHCGGGKENIKDQRSTEDVQVSWAELVRLGCCRGQCFHILICLLSGELRYENRGLEGSFVVVSCIVCQRCFDWAFMPVSSKALLPQDMQLEIDMWEDRESQTAGDTGTDYREAKRLCI